MTTFNYNKSPKNPLEGLNLDWNAVAAMRIVYDLHQFWAEKTEEEREEERWKIANLKDDANEGEVWDTGEQITFYCMFLAHYFSDQLGEEISPEGALELSLDFFARSEPALQDKEERLLRIASSSIVKLRELVWETAFAAGMDHANTLWEVDREVVSKMEGSFVAKEVE